mgnify:CR=1 FL=1
MSRLAATFERLAAGGRKALIPYVTSGFPAPALTVPVMHALVAGGADAIELGVPFSDPMADGPVIQHANECALALGVGMRDVLGFVGEFRRTDASTPVVLMGYATPVERMGVGFEYLYGTRENKDGASGAAHRLQAAFQYKF